MIQNLRKYSSNHRLRIYLPLVAIFAQLLWGGADAVAVEVQTLGLQGDGLTDDTPALQAALDAGQRDLYFGDGVYRLGTVRVPADVELRFSPAASISVVPEGLTQIPRVQVFSDSVAEIFARWEQSAEQGKTKDLPSRRVLFLIGGDGVKIEGLRYDFAGGGETSTNAAVDDLVYGRGIRDLTVADLRVVDRRDVSERAILISGKAVVKAIECRDVTLRDSSAEDVAHMLQSFRCENVDVHGNRMRRGYSITTFSAGGQWLKHHDNWSQQVRFQVVWRGGSPDPSRKAPAVPHGSANQVHHRDLVEGEDGWHPHTQGAFDVLIQNNYAEYGVVLCWGNKGRQVLIDGNTSRFMWDYAYGAEGGENHIFSNNISINSAVAGFMSMYWGEKMVISGNMIIVRHEPFDPELAKMPFDKKGQLTEGHPEAAYFGQFLRFHHGPPNEEDLYGTGSAIVTGNLFVNELADRPSGFSIENGRDMMISGNKFINAMIRVHGEVTRVKAEATDSDEFASTASIESDVDYRTVSRVSPSQGNRVTIVNNEFISRQRGDKPIVIINGSVDLAVVRDNTIRKEESHLRFTDEQIAMEQAQSPRYMLYAIDAPDRRELSNANPPVAITLAPSTSGFALIEGNLIRGWEQAIQTIPGGVEDGQPNWVIRGNFVDGRIEDASSRSTTDDPARGNVALRN